MRTMTMVLAALALTLTAHGLATSGECGGTVACACGDTLTGPLVLTRDLGPCPGDGLVLRRAASLDCQGHTISGGATADSDVREERLSTFGLILDGTAGAVVRGCRVTGFRYGIELSGARDSRVIDAEVFRNGDFGAKVGYGIHLSRSERNTIQECTVRENADEGIHVGTDSEANTLLDNQVHDNGRENLYILSARGNRLVRNRTWGKRPTALYMKHATHTVVEDNRFEERPVVIRGTSTDNVFVDNVFAAGLKLESYGDRTEATAPSGNVVRGGRLAGGVACLELIEAHDNRIEGVSLEGCRGIVARSIAPVFNDVLDVDVTQVRLELTGGATLRILRRVRLEARSPDGAPITGADVEVVDSSGQSHEAPPTDSEGAARCGVPVRAINAAGLVPLTPVTVTVRAQGYLEGRSVLGDPPASRVTLTLEAADEPHPDDV